MPILAILNAAFLASAAPPPFDDPSPPHIHSVAKAPAPAPQDHQELKFHSAPRPISKRAVIHDWPSFLGPAHNAISTETPLIAQFPKEGPRLVWEVAKGDGYAAPAISGQRLLLFHRIDDEEVIDCLHPETGQRYWRFAYPSTYADRYGYSGGPRCAPVIDGDRVYTYGVQGKLHCLDLDTGRVRWKRNILAEFKIDQNFFGVGSTPLVENDLLIINIGAPGGPTVAAFDKLTGRLVWGAGDQWGASYASPVPAELHGQRRVLVFAGGESRPPTGGLLCINPADGSVDFAFPWRGRRYESVNASNPVVIGNQVFLSESYGAGSVLIDVSPDLRPNVLWANRDFGTHFMTAIHHDGHLYGVHGHGPLDSPLVCLDLKTGEERWRHEPEFVEIIRTPEGERQRRLNLARASLLYVDGRFLCLGEYGHLLWLDLSPKGYRETSRAWLFAAGETWTGPVISRGLLYICQNTPDPVNRNPPRLLCYDLRGG